jgi:hypothetical protein
MVIKHDLVLLELSSEIFSTGLCDAIRHNYAWYLGKGVNLTLPFLDNYSVLRKMSLWRETHQI